MTRAELEGLRDRLYVLACAVEDVERDVDDATPEPEVREAMAWLLDAAHQAIDAMPTT
jgi:hypothetical protein